MGASNGSSCETVNARNAVETAREKLITTVIEHAGLLQRDFAHELCADDLANI